MLKVGLFTVLLCQFAGTALFGEGLLRQSEADKPGFVPDVVYIPTPHDVVDAMLQLAGVQKDDVVYDLGCGDGRILIRAAKQYGCQAVGCDIDPLRVRAARENVTKSGVDKQVAIHQQDMFMMDWSDATVVTLYLTPKYNARLLPQLQQLADGARVVSHMFEIPGLKPGKVVQLKSKVDGRTHLLYLWTAPLKNHRS